MHTDTKTTAEISVEERNRLVMAYLWCIDRVIRQNSRLVREVHLDKDDLYQNLAMRLIQAVESYQPGDRSLKGYIFIQLKAELLNCKNTSHAAVVSWEALAETELTWDPAICTME